MLKETKKPIATKYVESLNKLLLDKGVNTQLEYWDGHKHIDIAILEAKIFIEIDGIQHFIDPEEIERDFKRNHYSDGDDFYTIHIPNIIINSYLGEISNAIVKVVKNRKKII